MKNKSNQTASFMVRFQQKIFEENGESIVQWRGKISHIQDGSEQRFSDFKDALTFMQLKLSELTEQATKNESSENKDSILDKSLSMFKTLRSVGPKVIRETLKDPKKQFSHLQEEIQDKINYLGDEIHQKVQIDQWRNASRSDFNKIQNQMNEMTRQIKILSEQISKIKKPE